MASTEGMGALAEALLSIESEQSLRLRSLTFKESNISFVYNPLEYALETHSDYVRKYCLRTKHLLFLGMNPGPYGMAQNGVPFGEKNFVRNWLRIEGTVGKPANEHPLRPIEGLDCKRSEVSGQRFWALIQELCQTPQKFFEQSFVHNYCPLSFMLSSGKNVTPPELKVAERKALFSICDEYLCKTVLLLKPKIIIGIGKFAEERAVRALTSANITGIKIHSILHPSPVNPMANKGWKEKASQQLCELGVIEYLKPDSQIPVEDNY